MFLTIPFSFQRAIIGLIFIKRENKYTLLVFFSQQLFLLFLNIF